jgi:hypothetical protein
VSATDLYNGLRKMGRGERLFDKKDAMSRKAFGQKLTVKGIGFRKTRGVIVRIGLQLKASAMPIQALRLGRGRAGGDGHDGEGQSSPERTGGGLRMAREKSRD